MHAIRPIVPQSLVPRILELWNRELSERFPLDERLLLQQLRLEKDESLCLAAMDGEGAGAPLSAVALFKRASRPDPDLGGAVPALGHLSFLIVASSARRRGLGSELLRRGEHWLRERGVRELALGRDYYHFFPGLPLDGSLASKSLAAFLEARGFEKGGEEHDLAADLGTLALPSLAAQAPRPSGYRCCYFDPTRHERAQAFFRRCFPGRWEIETEEAAQAGMRPEDLLLLEEEQSGDIVGFARLYDPASPLLGPGVYWRSLMGAAPGGLGPIGVDASRRGLGLGIGLLRAGLEELARRGVRTMVIDWTDLPAFYEKMGFRIVRTYCYYTKHLEG